MTFGRVQTRFYRGHLYRRTTVLANCTTILGAERGTLQKATIRTGSLMDCLSGFSAATVDNCDGYQW